MNAQAVAITAESTRLMPITASKAHPGRVRTVKERRELEDVTDWLAEQEDAEVSLLIQTMSNRSNRPARYSTYD